MKQDDLIFQVNSTQIQFPEASKHQIQSLPFGAQHLLEYKEQICWVHPSETTHNLLKKNTTNKLANHLLLLGAPKRSGRGGKSCGFPITFHPRAMNFDCFVSKQQINTMPTTGARTYIDIENTHSTTYTAHKYIEGWSRKDRQSLV